MTTSKSARSTNRVWFYQTCSIHQHHFGVTKVFSNYAKMSAQKVNERMYLSGLDMSAWHRLIGGSWGGVRRGLVSPAVSPVDSGLVQILVRSLAISAGSSARCLAMRPSIPRTFMFYVLLLFTVWVQQRSCSQSTKFDWRQRASKRTVISQIGRSSVGLNIRGVGLQPR